MSTEFSPNGVSFTQIKKDAKKLKKENDITYLEALDLATKNKTDFNKWTKLEEFVKSFGGTASKINFYNKSIVMYKTNNLMGVFTTAGGGKSIMLIETLFKNHKKYKKIGFVNNEYDPKKLIKILPTNTTIINDINDITDDMDIVFIDSLFLAIGSTESKEYLKLLKLKVPVLFGMQLNREYQESGVIKMPMKFSRLLFDTTVVITENKNPTKNISINSDPFDIIIKEVNNSMDTDIKITIPNSKNYLYKNITINNKLNRQ